MCAPISSRFRIPVLHSHHCSHRALRTLRVGIGDRFRQHNRRHLPRESQLISRGFHRNRGYANWDSGVIGFPIVGPEKIRKFMKILNPQQVVENYPLNRVSLSSIPVWSSSLGTCLWDAFRRIPDHRSLAKSGAFRCHGGGGTVDHHPCLPPGEQPENARQSPQTLPGWGAAFLQ